MFSQLLYHVIRALERKQRSEVLILLLLLALPAGSPAQDLARRLILKDGSYQLVTKYETKGDRVRYLSAERNEWEELPESLVDWPATEKYEKERVAGASVPEAVQLDKEIEEDRAREETLLPQVAPGLRLPQDSGVFLLDSFQGEPQIVEIQQTAGDLDRNTKGNIFRGAINPVAGLKQIIELDGAHAPVQSHVDVPSLYIRPDAAPDQANPTATRASTPGAQASQPPPAQPPSVSSDDRFRIVRTEVKNGKRILGEVKRQVTGKISQQQNLVKTTSTRVSGGWLKLTPTESLSPGEYVLVERMPPLEGASGKEGMNLYVWDFGVNPKAPANANPWKPSAPEPKLDPTAKPN
ncbi:MAG TPA: hypothetical protein VNX60_15320 [Candidatus Acidoferrum sp.]|nr:hypothetical protein [Candidatus Acidoferrum sp.]